MRDINKERIVHAFACVSDAERTLSDLLHSKDDAIENYVRTEARDAVNALDDVHSTLQRIAEDLGLEGF